MINQIKQTEADGQNDDDDGNEDQGARGPTRREDQDNLGLPPTQLKSHNTDNRLMSKLELRMREMVKNEFLLFSTMRPPHLDVKTLLKHRRQPLM